MTPEQIRQRFESLWSTRKTIEQAWDLVTRFVDPMRGGDMYREYTSEHAVEWSRHRREVYDSTVIEAASTLASSLHGGLTTPVVRWFGLTFRNKDLRKDVEAKRWIEECADICWDALRESNFNLHANEMYLDLVSYGSAPLAEEELTDRAGNFDRLNFSAYPAREFYFEPGIDGRVYRAFRRHEWTATEIVDQFGHDAAPEKVRTAFDNSHSADERFQVIFCIYPRDDQPPRDEPSQIMPIGARPYGARYVLRDDAQPIGEELGYYGMPVFLPRWRKTSGSMWGFSPAMVAMGFVLSLNDIEAMALDALEKVIDPPMLARERGLMSDRDLAPGGLTIVKDLDAVKVWESVRTIDWRAVQLKTEQMSGVIRRIFMVDQLELKESPAMTATEVQVRYELMQRLLGPTLGRLEADFLDPTVMRTFFMLHRAGQLPIAPQIVQDQEAEMDIKYAGPLARAQRSDEVASIERWTTTLISLAAAHPRLEPIIDRIKVEDIPKELGDRLGVTEELIRSDGEVKQIQEERRREEQAAKTLAAAQQGAAVAKDASQALQAVPQPAPAQGGIADVA